MLIALIAAVCVALSNSVAALFQKQAADRHQTTASLQASLLIRLSREKLYLSGIGLDLLAGILTLFAVHRLPLFLAQSVIAGSVLTTPLLERKYLKRRILASSYIWMAIMLVGLCLIAATAPAAHTALLSDHVKIGLYLAPLVVLIAMALSLRESKNTAATLLAVLAGLSFGGVSIIGRVLVYPHDFWRIVLNPLALLLIPVAGVAVYSFTLALQRGSAARVNSLLVSSETLIPIVIGIGLLGDRPKQGTWPLLIVGVVIVIGAGYYLSRTNNAA